MEEAEELESDERVSLALPSLPPSGSTAPPPSGSTALASSSASVAGFGGRSLMQRASRMQASACTPMMGASAMCSRCRLWAGALRAQAFNASSTFVDCSCQGPTGTAMALLHPVARDNLWNGHAHLPHIPRTGWAKL